MRPVIICSLVLLSILFGLLAHHLCCSTKSFCMLRLSPGHIGLSVTPISVYGGRNISVAPGVACNNHDDRERYGLLERLQRALEKKQMLSTERLQCKPRHRRPMIYISRRDGYAT